MFHIRAPSFDTLSFNSGVTAADIAVVISGSDLIVGIKDLANPSATFAQLTDKITLQGWSDPLNRIEYMQVGDVARTLAIGTAGAETVGGSASADWLFGLAGNDTISAGGGDDILVGGTGNDTLNGGAGYDRYVFDRGDGQDVINNGVSSNSGASGELDFTTAIAINQLWFRQSGNDLLASVIGTQDRVTIAGWYSDSTKQLQAIKAGGDKQIDSGLAQLVQAMAGVAFVTRVK